MGVQLGPERGGRHGRGEEVRRSRGLSGRHGGAAAASGVNEDGRTRLC